MAGFRIIQPQLSAAGPASAFLSHMPAARTNSHPPPGPRLCAIPGEASREPSPPALPAAARGIRYTCEPDSASLPQVGSLEWGAQRGVPPPGRWGPHCPNGSTAWGFSSLGVPHRTEWGPSSGLRGFPPPALSGEGSVESLLLAVGFPRHRWEHSLGQESFFSAMGSPKP